MLVKRVRYAVVVAVMVSGAAIGAAQAESAHETTHHHAAKAKAKAKQGATLRASTKQATEGDRYTLTATIKSPSQAAKVTLQKLYVPLYYGEPVWQSVKTLKVRGRNKVTFRATAIDENTERHRVSVTYKRSKPVTSKSVLVTVWRWIPLSEYRPYYESQGGVMGFKTVAINGQAYAGWGVHTWSHTGTWEARFTPGRHCDFFRGVFGVEDVSADGSSATIALTADEEIIYTSPSLTPGTAHPATVPLTAKPFRLGIQLSDTTPGGTTGRDAVESWPVIGDPAFRCTGA